MQDHLHEVDVGARRHGSEEVTAYQFEPSFVIRSREERLRLLQHLTLIEQDGPLNLRVGVQDGPKESTVTAAHVDD